jgi:hypothetical protein
MGAQGPQVQRGGLKPKSEIENGLFPYFFFISYFFKFKTY